MLDDTLRDAARHLIQARFDVLDEQLRQQLDELSVSASAHTKADELARVGVRVRLVCEQDMNERAYAAWQSIRRAHQRSAGHRTEGLLRELKAELHLYTADAAINLANHLADHAGTLAPTFSGNRPLDADWIRDMQKLAEEKQLKSMEQYVNRLSRGLKSWVSGPG